MRVQERRLAYTLFLLLVSLFGLVVSASLLGRVAPFPAGFTGRRAVVGLVYGFVCIVGMLAVLFPVACSGVFVIRRPSIEELGSLETRATKVFGIYLLHGHHPPEPEAAAHEFLLGKKRFCASCFGLSAGAILALATIAAFALSGWADTSLAYGLYCVGVAGAVLGLVQAFVLSVGPRARFILAVVFVLGTSLILIATDILTANLAADLFVVLLAIFWLLSRVSLSHHG